MLLLLTIACFEEPAAVVNGPALPFMEMPCEYEETAKLDDPQYLLPDGAVVVSAEECFTSDGLEICQSIAWLRASNGFVVGDCTEGSRDGVTAIIHYLE